MIVKRMLVKLIDLFRHIYIQIYIPDFPIIEKPYEITYPFQIIGSSNIKIGKNFTARLSSDYYFQIKQWGN